MAFQTGTASSFTDFFIQLRAFATSNAGFSNNGTSTINGNTVHSVSKGGIYWNFEEGASLFTLSAGFTFNYARMRMTYSLPNDVDGFNQSFPTGQPRYTAFGTNASTGPFTGHTFYTEGTAVHAVLEVFPNVFQHLSFGSIEKSGAWAGGEYLTASSYARGSGGVLGFESNSSQHPFADSYGTGHAVGTAGNFNASVYSFVRYVQSGTNNDDFAPLANVLNNQVCRMSGVMDLSSDLNIMHNQLVRNSPNQANLRSALFPMYVRLRDYTANSPATLDAYFIAGTVPGVRVCNVRELNPHEIVNTDWQVFPIIQKDGDDTVAPISGEGGFAYQRVV